MRWTLREIEREQEKWLQSSKAIGTKPDFYVHPKSKSESRREKWCEKWRRLTQKTLRQCDATRTFSAIQTAKASNFSVICCCCRCSAVGAWNVCGSWSPINAIFESNSKWILVFLAQQASRLQDPRRIFHSFHMIFFFSLFHRTIDFSFAIVRGSAHGKRGHTQKLRRRHRWRWRRRGRRMVQNNSIYLFSYRKNPKLSEKRLELRREKRTIACVELWVERTINGNSFALWCRRPKWHSMFEGNGVQFFIAITNNGCHVSPIHRYTMTAFLARFGRRERFADKNALIRLYVTNNDETRASKRARKSERILSERF